MTKYSSYLGTPRALALLPSDLPLDKLKGYMKSVLRDTASKRRNAQVVHHLVRSENRQLHAQLVKVQSEPIRIAADRICDFCQKRLGTTVFARYPNGVVIHLKCMKDKNVCPVTGVRFNQLGADVK